MITQRHRGMHGYARLDTDGGRLPAPPAMFDPAFLQLDLSRLVGYLVAHVRLIGACIALGVVGAVLYAAVAPARYTTSSEILIDPTGLRVIQDDLYSTNDQRDALLLNVESRMRILVSSNVLSAVVDQLGLTSDPEFVSQTDTPPELAALRTLERAVKVSRDEKSFVVTLTVTTRDPQKSVSIAQAIVEAFKIELAGADADGASRTAEALSGRLAALKDNVAEAEAAVESFKNANNLQSSGGELVSTLSMTQLNNQVAEARQRFIEAKTRYEELASAGDAQAATAASQDSTTLTALRGQFATLMQEAEMLSQTLGPRHPKYLAIEPQIAALRSQIKVETDRIVAAAKSDYEQAQAVLSSLGLDARNAEALVASDNAAQVTLRALERDAASQAAIYEAFLARARQVAEREQINTTNIRVISEPFPPRERSSPPATTYLIGLGGAAGLASGAILALILGITGWRFWRNRKWI